MSIALTEVRQALRRLLRRMDLTLVVVLSLALGIGANTAVFSLVEALLLRPLPSLREPGRLVAVYNGTQADPFAFAVSYPNFLDYRESSKAFSRLAAYTAVDVGLARGGEPPDRVQALAVTTGYFETLGVEAAAGRAFAADEDQGAHRVAVLSDALWRSRFGGDPGAVGATVTLSGTPFEVVGVAPPGFQGADLVADPALWVPVSTFPEIASGPAAQVDVLHSRQAGWFSVVGRLAPGVDLPQAQAELATIAARLAEAYPEANQDRVATLVPLTEAALGVGTRANLARYTGLLMVAVGLVLLSACFNIANLYLSHGIRRQKEIAVRLAIGASRGRVVRQLLVEALLLTVAAAAASILVARWLMLLLPRLELPASVTVHLGLSPAVLGFALAATAATVVLSGLLPALRTSKPELVPALKEEVPSLGGQGRSIPVRSFLVVAQVTLSVVVLVGSGLMVRTLRNLLHVDLGFNPDGVVAASIDLAYGDYGREEVALFYRQLSERVESLPGVEAASVANALPVSGQRVNAAVTVAGFEDYPDEETAVQLRLVGPGYFRVLERPLMEGRGFTAADGPDAPAVAVVNRTMARRFWPDGAVGGRIENLKFPGDSPLTVVGVVADARAVSLREEPGPVLYLPHLQNTKTLIGSLLAPSMTLLARSPENPGEVLAAVRREVAALDAGLPVFDVTTLSQHTAAAVLHERQAAILLSLFALVGLGLAAVGIYGTLSYMVRQRNREIGIRMALGAEPGQVLRKVLGQGTTLVLAGVILGLGIAAFAARLMADQLFGINALDLPTFGLSALVLMVVALLAAYLPARRATRTDPVSALKG